MKDRETREQYEEWIRRSTQEGKDQDSKFNTFKKNRHKIKTDAERRAERQAKYGKYNPGADSAFHTANREFTDANVRSTWDAFVKG